MTDCWVIYNRGALYTHPDRYVARRWENGHLDPYNILSDPDPDNLRGMMTFLGRTVEPDVPPGHGDRVLEWWS